MGKYKILQRRPIIKEIGSKETYWLGMNHLGDMTQEDVSTLNGFVMYEDHSETPLMFSSPVLISSEVVSFPDPAFTKDKGLAHFARNLGLADSALPEIWRTNQIILADHVVRIALPKRTLESYD